MERFFLKQVQGAANYSLTIAMKHGGYQIRGLMENWAEKSGVKYIKGGGYIIDPRHKRDSERNTLTKADIDILEEKFDSVEHKEQFDRILDKFYKMLDLNPTLREAFDERESVFNSLYNRTASQLRNGGGIRKLHRGTTMQDGANMMGDEGGEYGDEPRIRKTMKAGRGGRGGSRVRGTR